MTERELQEFIRAIERVHAEHATSREKAVRFLQRSGFLNEAGELAEPYAPEPRQMTEPERASMEQATREVHAEFDGLFEGYQPRRARSAVR